MNPVIKEMDAMHSGTGVFYQAMPAVGADGKNIMKLIPVQMIDGQFFKTQMSKPQTDPTPQKAVNINMASASVQMGKKAALNPSPCQIFRQQVTTLNVLPNPVGLDPRNSLNKHPLLPHTVSSMAKIPPKATLSTNSEKSLSISSQLPVTVKSPALPIGQYLQIPPNAQVRTVPASELPPGIKKQIFTSASSSPGSGAPSVVYVSPVTTVNQGVGLPSDSALHSLKLLSKTSNTTACGPPSKGSKRHLKLIPKVSHRPNSPIKWMIEEEDSSTLAPLNSPSEILLAMAERKNAVECCDVMTGPVSQVIPTKGGQGEENALVMCNGKVFFVAKKCSLPHRMRKSDSLAPSKDGEFNKSTVASSQQSLKSVTPEIRQDARIIISDESDEVIDLCDDDDDDDSSQQTAPINMSEVTHLDEDNVIFVSYIPPKSESGSEQDLILKTQMALVKGSNHMETSSLDTVTEQKSRDGTTGRDDSPSRGEKADQSMLVSTVQNVPHVCHSAVMKICDNDCSNLNSPRGTSTQQLESIQSPADPSTSDSSGGEDSHNIESSLNPATELTPSPAPKSHQMADHLLRQMFNITADVKIWLQRIDEASASESVQSESVQSESVQTESVRSVENLQEPTRGLKGKELLLQDFHSSQETKEDKGLINFKPVEVVSEQKLLADSPSQSPNIHTGPLKCSHFKQNTNPLSALKCNSSQSSETRTSCDVPDSALGYVEPIDEDFLSTDENDIPNSQDTDTQPLTPTCVDLNANTRRMGRTRKRTICPCCIAGSQVPVVKSSTKTDEPEKWTWTTEKTSKKAGRTKAVRKEVKTSGRISCLTAKKQQKCTHEVPANDSVSTTSMDSDELKQHEQMKRLKELLREKEAALDLMRHGMS